MTSIRVLVSVAAIFLGPMFPPSAQAVVQIFQDQNLWEAAVLGPSGVTVFHFDGPTELQGRFANDPAILPSYSSQGADFLPFTGTSVYPVIFRNQGHQISDPARSGLLANVSSPNAASNLDGRAIKLDFNRSIRSVGVFTNDGDGGFLRAFDASMNTIGQVSIASGSFGGLVTDQLISHVAIVNTFNADIVFGIWDLQFSAVGAIPEPKAWVMLVAGALLLAGRFGSRKRETSFEQ